MKNEILDDLEVEKIPNPFFKIKHVLIIFIIGWIVSIIGTLFKIQSWEGGSELLTIGTGIKVLSGIFGIIKLMTIKEVRSFFNR